MDDVALVTTSSGKAILKESYKSIASTGTNFVGDVVCDTITDMAFRKKKFLQALTDSSTVEAAKSAAVDLAVSTTPNCSYTRWP